MSIIHLQNQSFVIRTPWGVNSQPPPANSTVFKKSPRPHRFKGRDTRCDKSLRQVAATGCCNKSPRVACEHHCHCDRNLSLRSVAQIQTGLHSCDISQRQTKHKRLVAAAVQTRRLVAAICRIVCLLTFHTWIFTLEFTKKFSSNK